MRLKRLRGRKVVERVFRRGKRLRGKHMSAVLLKEDGGNGVFVAVSVSTQLAKSAVDRNRMRRRCSEALRVLLKEHGGIPPKLHGAQLLLLPRPSSLNCDFAELKADLRSLLSL